MPAVWFHRSNFPGGRWLHHSTHDTLANVSAERLCEIANAAATLISQCGDAKTIPFKGGIYKWVRHPLMAGFLLAMWATPDMTVSHLAYALGMTIYIFVGIRFEENEMVAVHGDTYRKYQQRTRMVLPLPKGK